MVSVRDQNETGETDGANLADASQHVGDILAASAKVHHDIGAFPGEVINDGKTLDSFAVRHL